MLLWSCLAVVLIGIACGAGLFSFCVGTHFVGVLLVSTLLVGALLAAALVVVVIWLSAILGFGRCYAALLGRWSHVTFATYTLII